MYEEHLTEGMENVQEVMISIIKDKGQVGNGKARVLGAGGLCKVSFGMSLCFCLSL